METATLDRMPDSGFFFFSEELKSEKYSSSLSLLYHLVNTH